MKVCNKCSLNYSEPLENHFSKKSKTKDGLQHMVRDSVSTSASLEELQKCEVRCCNCHRRKTIKQFGVYKDILL